MQNRKLSLLGTLDNGLTHLMCLCLTGLKNSILWLIGLLTFLGLPVLIFEYNEGLNDLSLAEWFFIPLMALLLRRHIKYCKHYEASFGRGLGALFKAQGVVAAIELIVIGLVAYALMGTDKLKILDVFIIEHPITKLTTLFMILLATYLAAPTQPSVKILQTPLPQNTELHAQPSGKEALV